VSAKLKVVDMADFRKAGIKKVLDDAGEKDMKYIMIVGQLSDNQLYLNFDRSNETADLLLMLETAQDWIMNR